MTRQRNQFKKSELIERLESFKFNEHINFSDVINIWKHVDDKYRSFAISSQLKRMYIIPYVIMFYTNKTIITTPFVEMFEKLKELVKEDRKNRHIVYDIWSPRMVMNEGMVLMDVFPTNRLRYNTDLYTMDKNMVVLNDVSIEDLDEYQEIEIRKVSPDQFTLSKPV